jgi:hypothetical protein
MKTNQPKHTYDPLNGYNFHNTITLDGKWTYERPVCFEVVKTAFGGWWGIASFEDGTTLKKFRGQPARIIPVANLRNQA